MKQFSTANHVDMIVHQIEDTAARNAVPNADSVAAVSITLEDGAIEINDHRGLVCAVRLRNGKFEIDAGAGARTKMPRIKADPRLFEGSITKISPWFEDDFGMYKATRVWVCYVPALNFWWQRHEWLPVSANQTDVTDWIPTPIRKFQEHMFLAPEDDI